LHRNVFFLGLVSFLTDVSSELIFTILPLFLVNVLGVATIVIGLIEGLGDSAATLLKILSGWLSDRVGRRKPLAFLGYGLSTLAKPFMYLATSWGSVLAVRLSDRVGKGIRSSPRDALITDSVAEGERGKAFGLHRAMDTSGAAVGLMVAAVVVFLLQRGQLELTRGTYQQLVLIGMVPAVAALLIFLFVRERRKWEIEEQREGIKGEFDPRFKVFMGLIVLFSLGNSHDAFLILRAQDLGSSVLYILLMLVLCNLVYAATSIPAGMLSDKLGRKGVILIGWSIYALVYLGFALVETRWQVWGLFALYGLYYGVTEGVARAFVADMVPVERRGTAYGFYHTAVGITALPASLIAGWLWQAIDPAAPFLFGSGLALLAAVGLVALGRQ
jgi:MFS family permease